MRNRMLRVAALLASACAMSGCMGADYDIAEVASREHIGHDSALDREDHVHDESCRHGEDHAHESSPHHPESPAVNPHPRYNATCLCVAIRPAVPEEPLLAVETSTGMHLHDVGERNHGTVWFFNQPWAASFIWGKMIRDTAVLLGLAVLVQVLSRRPRSRRRRT